MQTKSWSIPARAAFRPDEVLQLRLTTHDRATVIAVDGALDISTCHLLTELAQTTVQHCRPGHQLILDITGLRLVAAAGIRALLSIRDDAVNNGIRLVLRNPGPLVERALTITNSLALFQTEIMLPDD